VTAENVTFTWNGSALTIGGTSLQNGSIAISATNPPSGWVNGGSNTVNPTTAPQLTLVYTDVETSTLYSSGFDGSTGNISIIDYEEWPNAPATDWDTLQGILRIGFSGTLKDATGDLSISLSQGVGMISTNN
jgi:hypothetical protein